MPAARLLDGVLSMASTSSWLRIGMHGTTILAQLHARLWLRHACNAPVLPLLGGGAGMPVKHVGRSRAKGGGAMHSLQSREAVVAIVTKPARARAADSASDDGLAFAQLVLPRIGLPEPGRHQALCLVCLSS